MQKTQTLVAIAIFVGLWAWSLPVKAQQTAVEYMGKIAEDSDELEKDSWQYTRAVLNPKRDKRITKKREELISTIQTTISKLSKIPPYQDDPTYRDAVIKYFKLKSAILNDDFGKIVDMEMIAEQSYDKMEAYLMAKEAAREKLNHVFNEMSMAQKAFADQHNITLLDASSKRTQKLEEAAQILKYTNKVYLIFFKSYKQEIYLIEAVEKGNVNSIVQNKNRLEQYADEGLKALDTVKSFGNDQSLSAACRSVLTFYKTEASDHVPHLIAYYMSKEKLDKIKPLLNPDPQKNTKEVVTQYNEAVNELNQAVAKYNSTNTTLNDLRTENLKNWEEARGKFLAQHAP